MIAACKRERLQDGGVPGTQTRLLYSHERADGERGVEANRSAPIRVNLSPLDLGILHKSDSARTASRDVSPPPRTVAPLSVYASTHPSTSHVHLTDERRSSENGGSTTRDGFWSSPAIPGEAQTTSRVRTQSRTASPMPSQSQKPHTEPICRKPMSYHEPQHRREADRNDLYRPHYVSHPLDKDEDVHVFNGTNKCRMERAQDSDEEEVHFDRYSTEKEIGRVVAQSETESSLSTIASTQASCTIDAELCHATSVSSHTGTTAATSEAAHEDDAIVMRGSVRDDSQVWTTSSPNRRQHCELSSSLTSLGDRLSVDSHHSNHNNHADSDRNDKTAAATAAVVSPRSTKTPTAAAAAAAAKIDTAAAAAAAKKRSNLCCKGPPPKVSGAVTRLRSFAHLEQLLQVRQGDMAPGHTADEAPIRPKRARMSTYDTHSCSEEDEDDDTGMHTNIDTYKKDNDMNGDPIHTDAFVWTEDGSWTASRMPHWARNSALSPCDGDGSRTAVTRHKEAGQTSHRQADTARTPMCAPHPSEPTTHPSALPASATDPLYTYPGESILVLLHHGERALSEVMLSSTRRLSQVRIFALDLDSLPSSNYTAAEEFVYRMERAASAPHAMASTTTADAGVRSCLDADARRASGVRLSSVSTRVECDSLASVAVARHTVQISSNEDGLHRSRVTRCTHDGPLDVCATARDISLHAQTNTIFALPNTNIGKGKYDDSGKSKNYIDDANKSNKNDDEVSRFIDNNVEEEEEELSLVATQSIKRPRLSGGGVLSPAALSRTAESSSAHTRHPTRPAHRVHTYTLSSQIHHCGEYVMRYLSHRLHIPSLLTLHESAATSHKPTASPARTVTAAPAENEAALHSAASLFPLGRTAAATIAARPSHPRFPSTPVESYVSRSLWATHARAAIDDAMDTAAHEASADAVTPHKPVQEALRPVTMLLWRTRGGPMDEYAAHISLTHVPPTPCVTVIPSQGNTFTRSGSMHPMRIDNDEDDDGHNNTSRNDSDVAEFVPLCTQNQPAQDQGYDATVHGAGLVLKHIHIPSQLHSLSLWKPVYTMLHLWRTVMYDMCAGAPAAASAASSCANVVSESLLLPCSEDKTFTLIYLGASWCPPCMRFVNQMPELMEERLPRSVTSTVKADMDLAKPIFDFFGVEVIPTFIVLDNTLLRMTASSFVQTGSDGIAPRRALCGGHNCGSSEEESILTVMRRAELGRIQNSNMPTVSTFIEKHCCPLDLDCDF